MLDQIAPVLDLAKDYWPFITQIIVIWYVGQVFKKRVWTRKNAAKSKFVYAMRATLPIHSTIAGAIWGLAYPFLPAVAFVTTRGGAVNEGLLAGTLTMLLHTGLEHYATAYDIKWLLAILRHTVTETDASMVPSVPPAPPPAG